MTREAAMQADLFAVHTSDVPLRDDREAMSIPLVSLSKRKRTKPISWKSSDGRREVKVSAPEEYGIATIWDFDVVIWAISQIREAKNRGESTSQLLYFHPHSMLQAIGREVGGDHYLALEAALNRLAGTLVVTNIRVPNGKKRATFHLLEGWEHGTDLEGRSKGLFITLPLWLYESALEDTEILAIPPEYFRIKSGIGRMLYRLARRHAGKQATGWRFTMKELHARSGSIQPLNAFARDVRAAIAKGVPEYGLEIEKGATGEPVVFMLRDLQRVRMARRRDARRPALPESGKLENRHGGSPTIGHGGSPTKTRRITH